MRMHMHHLTIKQQATSIRSRVLSETGYSKQATRKMKRALSRPWSSSLLIAMQLSSSLALQFRGKGGPTRFSFPAESSFSYFSLVSCFFVHFLICFLFCFFHSSIPDPRSSCLPPFRRRHFPPTEQFKKNQMKPVLPTLPVFPPLKNAFLVLCRAVRCRGVV